MLFKISARNPYRDLVRNVRRIAISDMGETDKLDSYKELYKLLAFKLKENQRFLNSHAAFAQRCAHWNQRYVYSIKPVHNMKNPWLQFKREFEYAIVVKDQGIATTNISKSIAWFYNNKNRDDWLAC